MKQLTNLESQLKLGNVLNSFNNINQTGKYAVDHNKIIPNYEMRFSNKPRSFPLNIPNKHIA
jgi:hypothetical protein